MMRARWRDRRGGGGGMEKRGSGMEWDGEEKKRSEG